MLINKDSRLLLAFIVIIAGLLFAIQELNRPLAIDNQLAAAVTRSTTKPGVILLTPGVDFFIYRGETGTLGWYWSNKNGEKNTKITPPVDIYLFSCSDTNLVSSQCVTQVQSNYPSVPATLHGVWVAGSLLWVADSPGYYVFTVCLAGKKDSQSCGQSAVLRVKDPRLTCQFNNRQGNFPICYGQTVNGRILSCRSTENDNCVIELPTDIPLESTITWRSTCSHQTIYSQIDGENKIVTFNCLSNFCPFVAYTTSGLKTCYTLQLNDSDTAPNTPTNGRVAMLQDFLIDYLRKKGAACRLCSGDPSRGYYGGYTSDDVKSFQSLANNIPPVGPPPHVGSFDMKTLKKVCYVITNGQWRDDTDLCVNIHPGL